MLNPEMVQESTLPTGQLGRAEFVLLYEANVNGVARYICCRIGPDEAEDLTAQAFARVWASRLSYDARKGLLATWLWAIVRNTVKDHLRQKHRRPQFVPLPPGLIGAASPLEAAMRQEDWRQLRVALSQLPIIDQEIIALRFGAGHTNRVIAVLVDLNEANVAQRLRRALRSLRQALEGKVSL